MTQITKIPGETYLFAGGMMTILAGGRDTDNRFALLLARVPPGNATPPHFHDVDAEHLVMLDGTITAETPGQTAVYQPGDVAVLPPQQVHRLRNEGSVDASYLLLCAPAGFDQFVRTVGRRVDDPAAAMQPMDDSDVQRLVASAPSFGIHLTDEAALNRPAFAPPAMASR